MVQELPTAAGTGLANWNWKSVRQFVSRRFGTGVSRSSCLTPYQVRGDVTGCNGWDLHSSGSKRHLSMADAAKREEFVAEYAALRDEAGRTGAKTFFADEAHFRAKAELRGKGVPRGKPALVDSNCPRLWREGQLLLGGVPGDGRGGVDGCFGRLSRRATATAEPRRPSCPSCPGGTQGG